MKIDSPTALKLHERQRYISPELWTPEDVQFWCSSLYSLGPQKDHVQKALIKRNIDGKTLFRKEVDEKFLVEEVNIKDVQARKEFLKIVTRFVEQMNKKKKRGGK
jgi:hypothetical protein